MLKIAQTIAISLFCLLNTAQSQTWYLSTEELKAPPTIGSFESSNYLIERYDTVSCKYKVANNPLIQFGFKLVFIKNGFYIDNSKTINVFFDAKKKRINNVKSFALLN